MYDKITDHITFPKTFENYKWYKPILVLVMALIIMIILNGITLFAFYFLMGADFIKLAFHGINGALNSPISILATDLLLIYIIPSLYLASKIVRDRPFSSYSSSRGGWNFKLYFKALIIPLILYIIYLFIDSAVNGSNGISQVSIEFILVLLICVPIQSIAEEYAFRGFIMQTVGSWLNIPILAIIIQAVLFGLGHGYNSMGLLEVIVMGIICGFLTWKTNGIEVSSAIHTANNFSLGLFIMIGLQTSTSTPQTYAVLSTIIFEIILFIIMYYVGRKTNWFGEIPENH